MKELKLKEHDGKKKNKLELRKQDIPVTKDDEVDDKDEHKFLEELIILKEIDEVNSRMGNQDLDKIKDLKNKINQKVWIGYCNIFIDKLIDRSNRCRKRRKEKVIKGSSIHN